MRPRQRPDDLDTTPSSQRDPVAREASGGGGKGGPLGAGKENDAKIQRSLSKKSGWGYYDPNTRERVPWYIDMINGGGMNAAGDTFEGGFGLPAVAGGVMNQLGIKPYGADRGRAYMPMEAWRGGDYTIGAQPAVPTPVGGGSQPAGLLRPRARPLSVSETAAMEDAYPISEYMYDYPTYAPQTGLNQYQAQYENIPALSQTIRLPEVVATSTANPEVQPTVDEMRRVLQSKGDPAGRHRHPLVIIEAYNRLMGLR